MPPQKPRLCVVNSGPQVDEPDPIEAAPMKRWAAFGGILLLAGTGIWFLVANHSPMRDLPETQRKTLFERTQANLRDICAPTVDASIHAFCRQQAELLLQFQECEADCQRLASEHLFRPTR